MQGYKTTTLLIAAATFGGLCSLAMGDDTPPPPPDPVFWSSWDPIGDTANGHNHIIRMVRHPTSTDQDGTYDPEDAAANVADMIQCTLNDQNNLGVWLYEDYDDGEICIYLGALGMGNGAALPGEDKWYEGAPALFNHWCDALRHHTEADEDLTCEDHTAKEDPCVYWWATPWMKHGVENDANGGCDWEDYGTGDWMDWFCYYLDLELGANDPIPVRFHLSTETFIKAHGISDGDDWVEVFAGVMVDTTRWGVDSGSGEDIYGFAAGTSMWDLWDDAYEND